MSTTRRKVGANQRKSEREFLELQYQFEMQKHEIAAETTRRILNLVKYIVGVGTGLAALSIMISGLQVYIGQDVSSVVALVDSLNLGTVSLLIWALSTTGTSIAYKSRIKKIIKQSARERFKLERDDESKESSGLTDTGEAPDEN